MCLVYLDDIIIFGKTFEETLNNLTTVIGRLKSAGLKLKPSKCDWFKRSVKFLGHIASVDGIKCDPEKVSAVKDWPRPTSVHEVRQFMGFVTYYRNLFLACLKLLLL